MTKFRKCDWCKGWGYKTHYSTSQRSDCSNCEGKGMFPAFTEEEKKQFITACGRTWDAIGSDVEDCARQCGEKLTKAGIVESVLDADRMDMYGIRDDLKGEDRKRFVLRMRQIRYSNIANTLCRKAISY